MEQHVELAGDDDLEHLFQGFDEVDELDEVVPTRSLALRALKTG